jgi:ribosomal protein S18 acetylase RimI-like enzyme
MRTKILVREARRTDIPALVEMNRLAYPELIEFGFVWQPGQLEEHLTRFPAGQLVAEMEGRIVGAISSLIIDPGDDPRAAHTWAEVTAGGSFATHDADADTLYLADIYVHPDARGLGVARALHMAWRPLCGRLGLRGILAGGRLWNYWEHADTHSPEAYVARVVAGELFDRVLSVHLRDGFSVAGLLPGYLPDPRGLDYGVLLEWLSPQHPSFVTPAIVSPSPRPSLAPS